MASGDGETRGTASPKFIRDPWLKLPERKYSGETVLGPTSEWTKVMDVPQKCPQVRVYGGR